MKAIVISWPRFGAYHLARIRAARDMFSANDVKVIGLEIASKDNTYRWNEYVSNDVVRKVLFSGQVYDNISPVTLWQTVHRFLSEINPAAVAINGYSSIDALSMLVWCKLNRRSAILMTESKRDDAPRKFYIEWVKSLLVRLFDAAVCGGTPQRHYLEELGLPTTRIFMGYDVVDNNFFSQKAAQARENPSQFVNLPGLENPTPFFLSSSRFIKRKNIDGLLRAYFAYRQRWQELYLDVTPWRLVILGDGEERSMIENLISVEQIDGVTLAGFRQIEEIPVYYGLASVFVHAAFQEQWGLVVNEAMASGLPVLVSKACGCVADLVVDGQTGFGFDPSNLEELVDKMLSMSSPEFALQKMARAAQTHISSWRPEIFGESLFKAVEITSEK